ncbi:hypothetical protein AC99_4178 [Escherichia coli 2-222-05_S4_C2]|nr:hypothetical protein AC99_4178 [Escherichia coli 2-222-05_S4_C2]
MILPMLICIPITITVESIITITLSIKENPFSFTDNLGC